MKARSFPSVASIIERLNPSYPVFIVWPEVLREKARLFVEHFPGEVLYAVKCNPHPFVLKALSEGGITSYDTASLPEIAAVRELLPDADCYFNHPVKGRGAIDSATDVYGITDFVVDHEVEIDKIEEIAGRDVTVAVRFETDGKGAVYNLSSKFGAPPEEAVRLLKIVHERGMRAGLTFHVGSQCLDPDAYRSALKRAVAIMEKADVPLQFLDIGGGFPAPYAGVHVDLEAMLADIAAAVKELGITLPLMCEPGRALVADGCSLLLQVHLRKGDAIYVNEGIYGCLSEVNIGNFVMPARAFGKGGRALTGAPKAFRVFGPTCDSLDVMDGPFLVPDDIEEGDWIEVGLMGAYSVALATGFNGFVTDTVLRVDGRPHWLEKAMPLAEAETLSA